MAPIRLKYFGYHPYNIPVDSERNVELPIAFWFLEKFSFDLPNLIEVGEVTPFYAKPKHAVYDLATDHSTTIKRDAADVDYSGKHLLSISTIEHVGTSDYGQTPDPDRLRRVLSKMLSSKTYLITFALGYNPLLESLIRDEHYFVIERIAQTRWRQTARKELGGFKYHSPWYAGNGVCILTNIEDLHFEFERRSPLEIIGRCGAPNWSWRRFARAVRQELRDRKAA